MRTSDPRVTPPQPTTERRRARFRATQRIGAAPEEIFPLLCPVREYDYLPEWSCELVYTESGLAEEGCVFRTDREADGATTLVWEQVVTALDEAGDRHVAARRQEDFAAGIEAMEAKIERYLNGES